MPVPPPADPARDEAIYRRFGLAERRAGQIACMFLANHTPNKGLPVLLEAFSRLKFPYQLIVGPRGLKESTVEIKHRKSGERETLSIEEAVGRLKGLIVPQRRDSV